MLCLFSDEHKFSVIMCPSTTGLVLYVSKYLGIMTGIRKEIDLGLNPHDLQKYIKHKVQYILNIFISLKCNTFLFHQILSKLELEHVAFCKEEKNEEGKRMEKRGKKQSGKKNKKVKRENKEQVGQLCVA